MGKEDQVLLSDDASSFMGMDGATKRKRFTLCGIISVSIGFGLFVLGFLLKYKTVPAVVETLVYDNLDLVVGSETFDAFVSKDGQELA